MGSATDRGRLSRENWIDAALDVLAERGIEGVRIDRLCERLAVTKGSFYHHFEGREDLLDAVADYWANTQPKTSVAVFEDPQLEPVARLAAVSRLVTERGIGRRDHAMRAWGTADERAARAVRHADRQILDLQERLLRDLGVPAGEVQPLAQVLFFATIGAYDSVTRLPAGSRRQLASYLIRLVRERARSSG
jgi:AcrR family transcriptional regulator